VMRGEVGCEHAEPIAQMITAKAAVSRTVTIPRCFVIGTENASFPVEGHEGTQLVSVLAIGCSGPCSRTIRTARSRASGEYFLGLAIG